MLQYTIMRNLSCFISPEYHPIQNRINLFFLGVRVKKIIEKKKKFLKWHSLDVSKALFYLFLSLFLVHLVRIVFFRKPKIKTSFLTPVNSVVTNQATDQASLQSNQEATQEAQLSDNKIIIENNKKEEVTPTATPQPTATPIPTIVPTIKPTTPPTPTSQPEPTQQPTVNTSFVETNSNDNFYKDSILGWNFNYDKNINPNFITEDNQLKINFDQNIILIRPISVSSPHSYINDLATKTPTQEELKFKKENQDYRTWIDQSLNLMRSKFVKNTKNGEVAGLVRREHTEKNSSEHYPNLTMVKTINNQNFEFVFYSNDNWPNLNNQEIFYQIFFSFQK